MELELPELTDLNTYINAERRNRFIGAKIKKEMTNLVATASYKLPKYKKITKITFIWRHKNYRKDFDNVEFAQKWIRDGLVKAGVVENDGWKHLPPKTIHKHEVNKENPGVTVLLKGII